MIQFVTILAGGRISCALAGIAGRAGIGENSLLSIAGAISPRTCIRGHHRAWGIAAGKGEL